MKPKHYTQNEILEGSRIGIEFEFYTKISPNKVGKMLSEKLGKNVVVPKSITELEKKEVLVYHSEVNVTDKVFKLEADYSGGFDMFELITGPLDYSEARKTIISVFDWISLYGYTNDRCSIHLNVSFGPKLKSTIEVTDLNVLKFILNFDEKRVYEYFPERENSVYAKSIKKDLEHTIFFQNYIPVDFNLQDLVKVPNEKYYGINFLKKNDNYIEFRYLGGKNYENRTPKILEMMDFFIQSLFYNINHPEYTQEEENKLKNLFKIFQKNLRSINAYHNFKKDYKDVNISIDLKRDDQVIVTYWEHIKYRVFDLVARCGVKKGQINYDTEVGKLQIFECDMTYASITDLDVIKCKISNSNVTRCELFYNKIDNSIIHNANAVRENEFEDCKIKDTNLYATNICKDCVIENEIHTINGQFINGIIRKGTVGSLAKLDGTIQVEEQIAKNTKPDKKIIKDWKWLKSIQKT